MENIQSRSSFSDVEASGSFRGIRHEIIRSRMSKVNSYRSEDNEGELRENYDELNKVLQDMGGLQVYGGGGVGITGFDFGQSAEVTLMSLQSED